MDKVRAWNLTDAPGFAGGPRIVELCGQKIEPGHVTSIPAFRAGKKIQRLKDTKMIHLGPTPPDWYLALKRRTGISTLPVIVEKGKLPKPDLTKGLEREKVKAATAPEPEPAPETEATSGEPESTGQTYERAYLEDSTKRELRALCEDHGLSSDGNKAELVDRLAAL